MFMLKIIIVAAAFFVIISTLLYFLQNKLVFFPSKTLFVTPSDVGLDFSDIFLETGDKIKINAWFIPAKNSSGTILFCHGNGGNISNCLDSVSLFNDLGYNVMIFDYRGYGKSEGTSSEKGSYLDANAAFEYLKKTGIPEKKIILFGRSLAPISSI
jgi:pimeloyl-ACP methyl ester carboxylesterase